MATGIRCTAARCTCSRCGTHGKHWRGEETLQLVRLGWQKEREWKRLVEAEAGPKENGAS